jgi:Tol biopolymer transport system component
MLGTQLGHYRIERLLGSGGMGTVYLADDTKLGRRVALKVLSKELADDPDRRLRFEREARAAAALNHPNIVTIHSVEEVDGLPFLTLELIEGQTLGEIIPAGGLPVDRVLDVGIALADGVGAAHQRGITHRDLKPANVMLTKDGRLKILDFGLAKAKEEIRAAETAMPTASLTGEGRIIGTVAYMSPEQAEAKPVDHRSDVFSLGVILYELATGVRPFQGDTQMATLSAIIKDPPRPLAELRPGLPRDFARIVNRCLAKDPEDRYQSAKDLRNDLRALKNDLASGDVKPIADSGDRGGLARVPARRRRMLAIVGAVLGVTAIVTLAALWYSSGGRPQSGTRRFDSIKLTRLTTSGSAVTAAISPDGRYVAHAVSKDGKHSLWLRQVGTTSNLVVVPPDDIRFGALTFARDSTHIYYVAFAPGGIRGTLYQIPLLGGGARRIIEDVDTAFTFSPDGKQLAFVRIIPEEGVSAIMVAGADGTNERRLATRKKPVRYSPLGLAWSPDGRTIAATAANDEEVYAQIASVDVATGKETVIRTLDWRLVTRVAWLPDGDALIVNAQELSGEASNQIFLVNYPSGVARRLTNDLSSYWGLSVAADGKSFVAVRNERRAAIWTSSLDAPANATAITTDASNEDGGYGLALAADGRIVYTSDVSGNFDIWIMNPDGSRRVQLTSNPGSDIWPRVTNDGRYIVFISDRDGAYRAWRMALDGSGATRLTSDVTSRSRVNVSGDGKWVYYDAVTGEARRVSIDGGEAAPAFPPDLLARLKGQLPPRFHEPMPSPDGSAVAGHYQAERGERIAVISITTGTVKLFDTVAASGTWSPDGKAFYYHETRSGVANVMRQPLTGGPPSPVTNFTSDQIFGYAVSPDQKRLATVRGQVTSDVVLVSDAR